VYTLAYTPKIVYTQVSPNYTPNYTRVFLLRFYPQNLCISGKCNLVYNLVYTQIFMQAVPLYKHCVRLFCDGLRVANTVERLVQAHDSQLPDLEAAVLLFLKRNAKKFQV